MLIWGRRDGIVPPVYAEEFAQRIAGAQTAFIEGAGHLPHLEQTTHVLNSVNTFIV